MGRYRHLSVAIPMMAERENVDRLLGLFRAQTCREFSVFCCVNNLEGCDEDLFVDNQETLELLRRVEDLDLIVIDRSTKGLGWQGKQKGVGWARKLLFEQIMAQCGDEELVVSLDADTDFSPTYLENVRKTMNTHPNASALSVPYYHPLSGVESLDRPMLRYECYMRHFLLNMMRIGSPYAFTALGSAMVFPLWAYKRVGGITPLQGGEDFYLMQKFSKTGIILHKLSETVRPQGRKSDRVPFGTGPAIAKGLDTMAVAYPFYPLEGFDAVKATCDLFPMLYLKDCPTPMTAFLQSQLGTGDLWGPLRKNFRTEDRFVHACHERVDGLRILQFLRTFQEVKAPSLQPLRELCELYGIVMPEHLSFASSPISELDELRNALFDRCQMQG